MRVRVRGAGTNLAWYEVPASGLRTSTAPGVPGRKAVGATTEGTVTAPEVAAWSSTRVQSNARGFGRDPNISRSLVRPVNDWKYFPARSFQRFYFSTRTVRGQGALDLLSRWSNKRRAVDHSSPADLGKS